jgi:hypothetical protein
MGSKIKMINAKFPAVSSTTIAAILTSEVGVILALLKVKVKLKFTCSGPVLVHWGRVGIACLS